MKCVNLDSAEIWMERELEETCKSLFFIKVNHIQGTSERGKLTQVSCEVVGNEEQPSTGGARC